MSDDTQVSFGANGTPAQMNWGHTYPSTISYLKTPATQVPIISGLAVQRTRPHLFVARASMNQLQVLDKTSGALKQTLTLPSPGSLAVDPADNLWIAGASGITRHPVNGDGTLGSSSLTISALGNVGAIAVSPDGATLTATDLTTQQVRAFSTATGAPLWTLGQAGGYFTDATVADDKFYFRDVNGAQLTYLAFAPDGTFWLGDPGNFRTHHYSAGRSLIETVMALSNTYVAMVDPNNPSRLFAGYQEFSIDYSKPLGGQQRLLEAEEELGRQHQPPGVRRLHEDRAHLDHEERPHLRPAPDSRQLPGGRTGRGRHDRLTGITFWRNVRSSQRMVPRCGTPGRNPGPPRCGGHLSRFFRLRRSATTRCGRAAPTARPPRHR